MDWSLVLQQDFIVSLVTAGIRLAIPVLLAVQDTAVREGVATILPFAELLHVEDSVKVAGGMNGVIAVFLYVRLQGVAEH